MLDSEWEWALLPSQSIRNRVDLLRKPGGPFRVDYCLQFGSDKEDTQFRIFSYGNRNNKQRFWIARQKEPVVASITVKLDGLVFNTGQDNGPEMDAQTPQQNKAQQ